MVGTKATVSPKVRQLRMVSRKAGIVAMICIAKAFLTSDSYLIGRMVALDFFSIRDCLDIHF